MIGLLLTVLGASDGAFVETRLAVPKDEVGLLLRDLTGDGALDLVRVGGDGVELLPLGADGRYRAEPSAHLAWPKGRVGWEVCDLDGDGVHELLLLEEERGVVRHALGPDGAFDGGTVVLAETARTPAGVHRVHFVRDVDGDGRADLVLPGGGVHRLFLAKDEGFAPPLEVTYELRAALEVGAPESLGARFGQRVRVPWFRIEDVDGDGRVDLVSETSDRIAFHLADPVLASEPTWVLDLAALRAELPKRDGIDFDNLVSLLDQRVTWQVADLDGEGAHDLVVLLGSKLRVWLGGARTGPVGTPSQVLKSSGNVLLTFLRQAQGDPRPDLQILRAERISLSRVLRSLLLSSSVDFDVFTYANEGGAFSSKPTRRNRITLGVPRLLDLMDEGDDSVTARLELQLDLPTRRLPRTPGAPAEGDDVVDVADGKLAVFAGCAPAPPFLEELEDAETFEPGRFVEALFLRDFDRREDGATTKLDFGDVESLDFAPATVLRRATRGREPSLTHELASDPERVEELRVRDLDGDGVADVVVVGQDDEGWVVQLLVRR